MIIQQVHFINVQDAAICRRQYARVEVSFTLLNRLFNVERPHYAIFGSAHGQFDNACLPRGDWQHFAASFSIPAFVAEQVGALRIAAKATVGYDLDFGQQCSQGARCRRFGSSTLAANEDATNAGVNRVQNQRTLHALLTNNCSKWVNRSSWHLSTYANGLQRGRHYTRSLQNVAGRLPCACAVTLNGI